MIKKEVLNPLTEVQMDTILDTFSRYIAEIYIRNEKKKKLKKDFIPISIRSIQSILMDAQRALLIKAIVEEIDID